MEPATTGQLRTKVSDMEIGDYIIARTNVNNLDGYFMLWGDNPTAWETYECSITGENATISKAVNFPMVKVAKGLLISDRVVAHTITWDSLNSKKLIQGLPWNTPNIIPTMISNTSPSGVVSASNARTGYEAWKAFDSINTGSSDIWLVDGGTTVGWISYEFEEPKLVSAYSIETQYGSNMWNRAPKSWTFEGSNNGTNWIVLDERTVTWNTITTTSESKTFMFPNIVPFKMYRINIEENSGNSTFLSIGRIQMFETAGVIRSLTGGVAYADENGNKSTTDLGFGAFPTNNEWDKYIVNFPQEKIQAGKTLDDVFHWSGIYTWTQDTAMIGMISGSTATTSNKRIIRGNTNINRTGWGTSSTTTSMSGFRPVFVYNE